MGRGRGCLCCQHEMARCEAEEREVWLVRSGRSRRGFKWIFNLKKKT